MLRGPCAYTAPCSDVNKVYAAARTPRLYTHILPSRTELGHTIIIMDCKIFIYVHTCIDVKNKIKIERAKGFLSVC